MLEDKIKRELNIALRMLKLGTSHRKLFEAELYEWLTDNDGLNEAEWKRAAAYFAGWLASTNTCSVVVENLLELSK